MGPERRRWQLGRNQSPLTPASLSRARRSERERGGEQEELYNQVVPPGFLHHSEVAVRVSTTPMTGC